MSTVEGSGKPPRWSSGKLRYASIAKPRATPADFEAKFVEIGRLECEAHYGVGRLTIDHWLEQCGKERLIAARSEHVTKMGERETVDRWRAESDNGLKLQEMGRMLERAFPVEPSVDLDTAMAAAAYLRISRNGGWPVSQAPEGLWWVGTRLTTTAELIEFARKKGFEPANLTVGGK